MTPTVDIREDELCTRASSATASCLDSHAIETEVTEKGLVEGALDCDGFSAR